VLRILFIIFLLLPVQVYASGDLTADKMVEQYLTKAPVRSNNMKLLPTRERVRLLRKWAKNDVLPILIAYTQEADTKFEGVRNIGKAVGDALKKDKINVKELTDKNYDYWRGVAEMNRGNELITSLPIFLYIVEGEFDNARHLMNITMPFAEKGAVPTGFLMELGVYLDMMYKDLNVELQKGKQEHDKGNFKKAIEIYTKMLDNYSCFADAQYELFFSKEFLHLSDTSKYEKPSWKEAREKIYNCNFLYPTYFSATTREEAFELFRRKDFLETVKKDTSFPEKFLEYAEISLDIKEYGFATHIYWKAISFLSKDEQEVREKLPYMLYALEQLGVKKMKNNFKGEHEKSLKKIAEELRKRKEESVSFKSFAK